MTWWTTLAGLRRADANWRPHDYKQRHKNEGHSKKLSFSGKQFENFQPKKPKNPVISWRTKQKNHKTPGAKTEHESSSQKEINWSKIEKKNIQNETVRTLQD